MIGKGHPPLFEPSHNCTLWRYIDFTKFVELLESKTLTFPRADKFRDVYEGIFPKASVKFFQELEKVGKYPSGVLDQLIDLSTETRKQMFISCWCAQDHESAAMWDLYAKGNEGVAITTDYDALKYVMSNSIYNCSISKVKYIDFAKLAIDIGNSFTPYVYKRNSFSHENEVRALIWAVEPENSINVLDTDDVIKVEIDLNTLVKEIYVSPDAAPWFGNLVKNIADKYGLIAPVVNSSLYERPIY